MTENNAFELSRIYARGWSAGRKCDVEDMSRINELGDSLNPCLTPGEREHWRLGFTEAVRRQRTGSKKPHHHP